MPPPSTAITIVVAAHQSIPAPSAILRFGGGWGNQVSPLPDAHRCEESP